MKQKFSLIRQRVLVQMLIVFSCLQVQAGKERDCNSFEYRVDRELCEQRARAVEEEQEQVERRIQETKEQKMQEQQEKMNRVKKYRSVVNTLLGSTNSGSDLDSTIELQVDGNLGIESCQNLGQNRSFLSLYNEHKLGALSGVLTPEDYRNVLLNVILLPQSNGELFTDGAEEKSLLKQLEEYLLSSNRVDISKWTERYNQLVSIYNRFKATLPQLGGPKISLESVLPRTNEERESYASHLAPLRNYLGHATQWSEIDQTWAKKFFHEQRESSGRYRSGNSCADFKRRYVDPYQNNPEGVDPVVSNYLWLLMKYTYFSQCSGNSADEQKTVSMHKTALTSTVDQLINKNPLSFLKMNSRQLNIANQAVFASKERLVEELKIIGQCAYDQINWLISVRPQ